MVPRLLFSLIILICCTRLTAQESGSKQIDDDYRRFRKVFDKELSRSDTASLTENSFTYHPASLPGWLSHLPGSGENTIYALGISDPGMEEGAADSLALLRAKVVLALLLKPKISNLTDNYASQQNASASGSFVTKYVNYYRLLASLPADPARIRVVNRFVTAFDEAIILISYEPGPAGTAVTDSLMLQIDFYQAERQRGNRFEMEEKCEVYGLSKSGDNDRAINIFYYFYRALNNQYEIVSRYNGGEIDFPLSVFRYQSLTEQPSSGENENVSYKLTNGLWKAFLQSLVQNYAAAGTPDVAINQLTDQYTSSRQNLSRERFTVNPDFRLKALHVSNNRLSVTLK